jgi:1-deoxy-D-xylulose-5-phosphate synthase
MLAARGALDRGLKVRTLTLPDIFQDQDKPDIMYAQADLDADAIVATALLAMGLDKAPANLRA